MTYERLGMTQCPTCGIVRLANDRCSACAELREALDEIEAHERGLEERRTGELHWTPVPEVSIALLELYGRARTPGSLTQRIRAQQAGGPLSTEELVRKLESGEATVMHCPALDEPIRGVGFGPTTENPFAAAGVQPTEGGRASPVVVDGVRGGEYFCDPAHEVIVEGSPEDLATLLRELGDDGAGATEDRGSTLDGRRDPSGDEVDDE